MTIAQFKNKILDWVKTGIPKNIKSYNIRTLLQEISKKLPDVDNYQMNEMYALSKDNDDDNNLKSVKIKPLEYQDQELTPEEQEQALKNLGIKTILIEGNRYFLYKKPGNAELNIQQGDIAVLGWNNASSFILLLEYESGDPELFTSWRTVDSYGYLSTPSWKTLTNGQVWNFPSGKRGDSWAIRISNNTEEQGATNADGAVWLGGTSGIIVGHMTLLICMQNSAGGDYATVGHKYLIINQKKGTSVIPVATYSALPPNNEALIGVIYLVLDTGNTYYFDTDVNDYVQIGTVVEGTLITSTIFEDENNIPVIPEGTKLYLDTVTGRYYRWDGVAFIPLATPSELPTGGNLGDVLMRSFDNGLVWTNRLTREEAKSDSVVDKMVHSWSNDLKKWVSTGLKYVSGTIPQLEFVGRIKASAFILATNTTTAIANRLRSDGESVYFANESGVEQKLLFSEAYKTERVIGSSSEPLLGTLTLKRKHETVVTSAIFQSSEFTISLASPKSNEVNEYILIFKSGPSSTPAITYPSGVVWRGREPILTRDKWWTFVFEQVYTGSTYVTLATAIETS